MAMKRAIVKNNVTGLGWNNTFDTEEERTLWITENEALGTFGIVGDYTITLKDVLTDEERLLKLAKKRSLNHDKLMEVVADQIDTADMARLRTLVKWLIKSYQFEFEERNS
jgi:hypothetical protein